jgi:hypothetical protein
VGQRPSKVCVSWLHCGTSTGCTVALVSAALWHEYWLQCGASCAGAVAHELVSLSRFVADVCVS